MLIVIGIASCSDKSQSGNSLGDNIQTDDNGHGVGKFLIESDLAVRGKVTKVDYIQQENQPLTVLSIAVSDVFKGQLPDDSKQSRNIVVAYYGGLNTENGDIFKNRCPSLFYQEEEYLLFISGNGETKCPFVDGEHSVFQVFKVNDEDYVFNLDGFPITEFSLTNIETGVQQNIKFLQNSEQRVIARQTTERMYTSTATDGTVNYFCDCLTPHYDYEQMASQFIAEQRILAKGTVADIMARVLPSEQSLGLTLRSIHSVLKKNQQSQPTLGSKTLALKAVDDTGFKNFTGELNIELNPRSDDAPPEPDENSTNTNEVQ